MAGYPPRRRPQTSPRHAAPTRHPSQGDRAGPPHPHTHAHSKWVVGPDSPPGGWTVGGGGAPDLRRPPHRRNAPPPGKPSRHPHAAVGPVLGPHARTNRTRDTRVAEPRLPTPKDGRPGEGQRLTPDAFHNGGRPPPGDSPPPSPRHAAPTGRASQGDSTGPTHTHTRAHSTWVAGPDSPPGGRAAGGGAAPDQTPLTAVKGVEPVLSFHARTCRAQDTRTAHLGRRVAEGGKAPDTGRPSQR